MRKRSDARLQIHRETLSRLQPRQLTAARGGTVISLISCLCTLENCDEDCSNDGPCIKP